MKASVYKRYGGPDVLSFEEREKPLPQKNEILVKIKATTVNRTDCGFRKSEYFVVRLISGLFRPKKQILGNEFSGEIEAVGSEAKRFSPGDAVFGISPYNFGTHAEYLCIPENGPIALKPENISFNDAAAVCDGLMLAINYIRKIDFNNRPKVLINGASGSIGTAALQLARHFGAEITAVCNTKNMALVKTLGADEVIDYTREDFTKISQKFDVVLDSVGKSTFFKCRKILKPKGIYFSSELGPWWQNVLLALLAPLSTGRKVLFPIPKASQEDIAIFKELLEKGNYKAVIDKVYSFDQIVEATKYVETGEKTGNVVITL